MKNRSLLFAFALTIGLFATSCSDDDNDGETLLPVIGKWNVSKVGTVIAGEEVLIDAPQNEAGCNKDYLDLKYDNDVNQGEYDSSDTPCALITKTGSYSRSHNNLTTTIDGVSKTQDIMNLTLSELKVKDALGFITVYEKD
ncbi:MAG: lipocalin family protein [Flavobacteriales bacterium]|nr:lipocalin family protein [Flavobacteriales bacterium]